MANSRPFVSVVTPVYNGAEFLCECIESVLRQTHVDFEYIIVNNCSTDTSLQIAQRYAAQDARIKVHDNTRFLSLLENHNHAVSLISASSKYCKVVSADDWIFPTCIQRLVEHAERNPTVGMVGAYQLSGGVGQWDVRWGGVAYPTAAMSGSQVCRWHLLGGRHYLGTPTSVLYCAGIVRAARPFFPGPAWSTHGDTSACYAVLQHADFGFVHEVLSFERIHATAATTKVRNVWSFRPGMLRDFIAYGRVYLTENEYRGRLDALISDYYSFLALGVIRMRGREFWQFHSAFLKEIGYPLFGISMTLALCRHATRLLLNPQQTVAKALKLLRRGTGGHGEASP